MPSKVPAEIDMDDSDIEIPEEAMMPQQKSYLWATDLEGVTLWYFNNIHISTVFSDNL